jgi:hypothetical protein
MFHEGMDLTLLTSSKEEKMNSKKPLPSEIIPHFERPFHMIDNLSFKATTESGEEPFGHMILP